MEEDTKNTSIRIVFKGSENVCEYTTTENAKDVIRYWYDTIKHNSMVALNDEPTPEGKVTNTRIFSALSVEQVLITDNTVEETQV